MPKLGRVDLVGVGLNATDTIIALPSFPAPGSKVEYSTVSVLPGGQVATTVVACRCWGLTTRYVGKLGDDDAAGLHRMEFGRAGVETQLVAVPDCASPQSLIIVDAAGERTVLCRRDERLVLQPSELERDWIVSARALHIDGHDTAAAIQAACWARQAGIPVVADLDEAYPGVEELLANVDYLIVSRNFPSQVTGEPRLEEALQCMCSRYGSVLTAATLGEHGVVAWDGSHFLHAAAYRVSVADTTGAGDIFHAGFIYGLLQGWALQRLLDFACAAAALNCTAAGARGRIAPLSEIEDLIAAGERYPAHYSYS
ncbi:MAG: carbohydrate kinase family protein [Silvibacterium sp.]|nr:carbohydrate kinase family protein [Silvibacterium sp.]